MIEQRTLKTTVSAVGVGVHSGQKVELTLRPAPPDTGVVFRRTDLKPPVDMAVNAFAVSDTRMASTISPGGDPGRAQGADHRTPDVGLCRPGAGQPVHRHHVPKRCPSSTEVRPASSTCCKALVSNSRRRPSASCASRRRWNCAKAKVPDAQVGATGALSWLQAQLRDRVQPPGGRHHGPACGPSIFRVASTNATSPARAPSASPSDVEMMRSRGLGLGGNMDNVIVVDDYKRAQQPMACATTTSSSSTRSWMPLGTCTSPASRCWPATAPTKAATR